MPKHELCRERGVTTADWAIFRSGYAGVGQPLSWLGPTRGRSAMGFLDKAKEAAQQAQKKLEEAQEQFNQRQAAGAEQAAGQPPAPPPAPGTPPPAPGTA